MGYYTRYDIEAVSGDYKISDIITYMKFRNDEDNCFYPFSHELEGISAKNCDDFRFVLEHDDEAKWYDHDAEMRELSKQFPDVLFKLHGVGEENGDVWDKYYKDGKCQVCNAEMTIPPYDEKKLK